MSSESITRNMSESMFEYAYVYESEYKIEDEFQCKSEREKENKHIREY